MNNIIDVNATVDQFTVNGYQFAIDLFVTDHTADFRQANQYACMICIPESPFTSYSLKSLSSILQDLQQGEKAVL